MAIYFRNRLYLDAVTKDPPGREIAEEYLEWVWAHYAPKEGLYTIGNPESPLLEQAAVVEIYGLLCAPPSTYF